MRTDNEQRFDIDRDNFLFYMYFGTGEPLVACIKRAYLDFNRTMRGFQEVLLKVEAHEKATDFVLESLSKLPSDLVAPISQAAFDKWHLDKCSRLVAIYEPYRTKKFAFHNGQAQKWLNMALKYIYTFGEHRLPGYGMLYHYCHMPIDQIVLDALSLCGMPPLSTRWSRIDNYNEYLDLQHRIRDHFSVAPLDAEHYLWLGNALPGRKPIGFLCAHH